MSESDPNEIIEAIVVRTALLHPSLVSEVGDYGRIGRLVDVLHNLLEPEPWRWVSEILTTRREVGTSMAVQAAKLAQPADIAALWAALDAIRTAEPESVELAMCDLYRAIAEASANRIYGALLETLLDIYLPLRDLLGGACRDGRAAAARLRPLVAAIDAHDQDAAWKAAHVYLTQSGRAMFNSDPRILVD